MDSQMKRNNRPTSPQAVRQGAPATASPRAKRALSKVKIISIVAAVVLAISVFFVVDKTIISTTGVDNDKYQAVFLTNGQAYFGKLHGYGTKTPYMSEVYYFQAGEADQAQGPAQATQTLVKLGDEIHKPEDKLMLNKDAILFVENLSGEGSVVQAIKDENQ